MEHKSIVAGIITVVLIVVGMFVYAYIKKQEIVTQEPVPLLPTTTVADRYAQITRVDAKHFFRDGEHTLVGEIIMPTPCDLLNWNAKVQESMPETAVIDFDVVNHSESCAEVATPQRFKVTFGASEKANMRARFMGRDIELNLIPAGQNENPDDYELFIKG
jgi:hypothetical protein